MMESAWVFIYDEILFENVVSLISLCVVSLWCQTIANSDQWLIYTNTQQLFFVSVLIRLLYWDCAGIKQICGNKIHTIEIVSIQFIST